MVNPGLGNETGAVQTSVPNRKNHFLIAVGGFAALILFLFGLGYGLKSVFLMFFSLILLIFSPPIIAFMKVYFNGRNTNRVALDEKTLSKFAKLFAEPTERYVASLGNGYLVNYLAEKSFSKGFAVVSDKRVYFKGKCYYQENGKLKSKFEERIVDLKDVTGTGYTRVNPLYLLITALVSLGIGIVSSFSEVPESLSDTTGVISSILLFISWPTCVITLTMYILKRKNLFEISFAGGKIAFDTNFYDKFEIDDFQKQLRRAKDHIAESSPNRAEAAAPTAPEPASPISEAGIGIADELKKYAELLDQKLITQEEFEEMKKRLIFADRR
jgi:hypothetical protein